MTIIQNGDKILDVGVGLGRLLSKIDKNVRKYGVHISLSYLKEAKQKGIEVLKSKIEELPYLDDTFDIIITTDVLEHVFDLNLCVHQIKRVLKAGGLVLVRVPNEKDLVV
uniref:class I SAM-dependent methyltransferase n=1 Tax=Algoriphagus sp. TaxID=1872435 RepID=UPI004048783B